MTTQRPTPVSPARNGTRVLIYSHDTFGLGHLRRCRAIAHALVERREDISVLILSGSPIIGSFDFRTRVDFIRVPGIIKLRNGEYTPLNLHIDTNHTLDIRASIIEHAAKIFEPHLFLVDKEPWGLRGEAARTLRNMRDAGIPTVLGLRDVMDDPAIMAAEWRRKDVLPALQDLYEQIWVYGSPEFYDPFTGLSLPQTVMDKVHYTGFLRREIAEPLHPRTASEIPNEPFILVTPGGGGDGESMVDWVIRAYESAADGLLPAVIVLGPFMRQEAQSDFIARAAATGRIRILTFDAHIENIMARSAGVVAMGGYNTFCEILSFDRPAVLIPREAPRREQAIRAERAAELGLVAVLPDDGQRDVAAMVKAIQTLPDQPKPSATMMPGLLDGFEAIHSLSADWLTGTGARESKHVEVV